MDNIVADTIMEQLSEKDRLIMAIQKLYSIRVYLYSVQITTENYTEKEGYYNAGVTIQSFIGKLSNELFNVAAMKQKYYEAMTRNQKG